MLNIEKYRENFRPYIEKAFKILPLMASPSVLDVGCGTGVPTMILAELSNGTVYAVDIDQQSLDVLNNKIIKAGMEERIKTTRCSMLKMPFDKNYFDIIWAEGSIAIIGFEKGLEVFKEYLKQPGYIVLHDDGFDIEIKTKSIEKYGYKLLSLFEFGQDVWWNEYYSPLQEEINNMTKEELRKQGSDYKQLIKELKMFENDPGRFRSAYFILGRCL